jgi:hypothetical protein
MRVNAEREAMDVGVRGQGDVWVQGRKHSSQGLFLMPNLGVKDQMFCARLS